MEKFLLNYAIGTLLTLLQEPAFHAPFKPAFLKVFKVLWQVFGQEQEFQQIVKG